MPALRRPYQELLDDELIRLCKSGDQDAYAALVERYKSRVFSLAYGMVGQYQEAEDVAQEAFIHVFRAIDSFRLGDKFYSWIHRITANLAIDYLRKRRHKEVSLDAPVNADGDVFVQVADTSQDPEGAVVAAEFKNSLEKAISELPPLYRVVVILRHVHDMAYEDIAEILQIPLGTVKTRLFRAREILRRKVMGETSKGTGVAKGAQKQHGLQRG